MCKYQNIGTAKCILGIVNKHDGNNNILVPLNTKLSTIAAAIVAVRYPHIQIAYAVTQTYNTDNYSKSGTQVTIVNMKELFSLEL